MDGGRVSFGVGDGRSAGSSEGRYSPGKRGLEDRSCMLSHMG